MTAMHNIAWDENGQLEALTFSLDTETVAVEAMQVREILDLQPETTVPGARPLVDRVINFRGNVIPVADLRLAFGLPRGEATADSRIVVVEIDLDGEAELVGIKADKVHEVATLDRNASEQPPQIGMRWRRSHVRSLVRKGEGLVIVPDIQAIIAVAAEAEDVTPSH
jgi:purine-binding chemotaxis protein CheW